MPKVGRNTGASTPDGPAAPAEVQVANSDVVLGGDLVVSGEIIQRRDPAAGVRLFRERLAVARGGAGGLAASAVVIGDSLTEGFEPTKYGYRWPDVVARRLAGHKLGMAHYRPASANTFSSTSAADWPGASSPWTYAGTVAGSTAYGADLHAVTITGASGSASISYYGDVATIHYVRTPEAAAGGYSVELDGTEVDTLEANGSLLPGQALTVGTLGDYGHHTLEIVVPTGTLTLEGVSWADSIRWGFGVPFDAVRFHGLGHAGFAVPHFTATDTWAISTAVFAPQLVCIALGANDVALAAGSGGTPAEYRRGLIAMMRAVDTAMAGGTLPGYLLVEMPGLPDRWVDAAWAAADEMGGRAGVLDLTAHASFSTGWGSFDDEGHPNDGGHQWIADRFVELVDPQCPQVPATPADGVQVLAATPATRRSAWALNLAGFNTGQRFDASPTGATPGERRHRVWLDPGTYRAELIFATGNNRGNIEVLLAGTSLGEVDTYSASEALGHGWPTTTKVIDTPGWYPLVIRKVGTKNASSSDYWLRFIRCLVHRVET